MENYKVGNLEIAVSHAGDVIRLDWKGESSARQPSLTLTPFFEAVAKQAAASAASIEMHFEALEQFNSSTMTAIIQLVQKLRDQKIRLDLVYDATLKWQKLSFDALRIFQKPDGLLQVRNAA